jgi:hypothetical protein
MSCDYVSQHNCIPLFDHRAEIGFVYLIRILSWGTVVRTRIVVVYLSLACSTGSAIAANWKEDSRVDRTSGKTIIQMATVGDGTIRQFRRAVTSKLVLACTHPDGGGANRLSAFLLFSEPVAIDDVRLRYRYDNDPVRVKIAAASRRGDYLSLSDTSRGDDFLEKLKKSSELRIEANLPWAGSLLLQFDVGDADAVIKTMHCK